MNDLSSRRQLADRRAIQKSLSGKIGCFCTGRHSGAGANAQSCPNRMYEGTPLIHDLATARGFSDLIADVGRPPNRPAREQRRHCGVNPFTEITSIMGANFRLMLCAVPFNAARCASYAAGFDFVNILPSRPKAAFPNLELLLYEQFMRSSFSRFVREELRARKVRVIMFILPRPDTEIWSQVEGNANRRA